MNKHAYLVMAHSDFYTLEVLLKMLDDSRNDIYIHIDKKVINFEEEYFKDIVKLANVYFIKDRVDVKWGGATLVYTELLLLEEAVKKKYDYYHLLSGSDLPLKSQDFIHKFFDSKRGEEFIGFNNFNKERKKIKYYYLFQEIAPRKSNESTLKAKINNLLHVFFRVLDRVLILFQKIFGIDRIKDKNYTICRGAQWFSITEKTAKYIVENKNKIIKMCKFSAYPDEIFVQTLVYNSKYIDKIHNIKDEYEGCMRHIDWKRGWPYTFKEDDLDELLNSDKLFARKFNSKVDKKIIDKIYKNVIT